MDSHPGVIGAALWGYQSVDWIFYLAWALFFIGGRVNEPSAIVKAWKSWSSAALRLRRRVPEGQYGVRVLICGGVRGRGGKARKFGRGSRGPPLPGAPPGGPPPGGSKGAGVAPRAAE